MPALVDLDRQPAPPATNNQQSRRCGYVYYIRDGNGDLLETSRIFASKREAADRASVRKIAIAFLAQHVAANHDMDGDASG